MTLSPQPPSLFPFVPISYPFRPLLRRLHMILFALKSPYSFCWLSLGCVPRPRSGLKSLSSWWVKSTEESFSRWDLGSFDEPWSAQVILKRNSWSGRTLYNRPCLHGFRVNSITDCSTVEVCFKKLARICGSCVNAGMFTCVNAGMFTKFLSIPKFVPNRVSTWSYFEKHTEWYFTVFQ